MDGFYLSDSVRLQRSIEAVNSRRTEISRCRSDPGPAVDAAVKQAAEAKALLDGFRVYATTGERRVALRKFHSQLEEAVKGIQDMLPSRSLRPTPRNNPFTPPLTAQSFESDDRLAELKKVEREMQSLQNIYVSLHAEAVAQQPVIQTIADSLRVAADHTKDTEKELLISQRKTDRSRVWRIYLFIALIFILGLYWYLT